MFVNCCGLTARNHRPICHRTAVHSLTSNGRRCRGHPEEISDKAMLSRPLVSEARLRSLRTCHFRYVQRVTPTVEAAQVLQEGYRLTTTQETVT